MRVLGATSALFLVAVATALFAWSVLPAASSDSKTVKLVRDLSWQSVHGECRYTVWVIEPHGRPVERLLRAGKSATEDLVNALLDPERAVAAHLVLCSIWSRESECGTRSTFEFDPQPPGVAGRQLDLNSITEPGPDEVISEHLSGELLWRTYGGGRSAVVESSMESNLQWWCNYFSDSALRITGACSGRTRVSRPVQESHGPRHAARR
jgi:hypothetical protein